MNTVSVSERTNGAGETNVGILKLIYLKDPASIEYGML